MAQGRFRQAGQQLAPGGQGAFIDVEPGVVPGQTAVRVPAGGPDVNEAARGPAQVFAEIFSAHVWGFKPADPAGPEKPDGFVPGQLGQGAGVSKDRADPLVFY